jgi:hypothetical protein
VNEVDVDVLQLTRTYLGKTAAYDAPQPVTIGPPNEPVTIELTSFTQRKDATVITIDGTDYTIPATGTNVIV